MIEIEFTTQLVQQADCPAIQSVTASRLDEALESVFDAHPKLRQYVFDSDGNVLPHLAIFVNGEMIDGQEALHTPLGERTEIFVMQAVSGG